MIVKETPSWVKYIHQRIEKNKNFLGFISGPTGSGKSWSGLSIAEQLDPEFSEERIIFKTSELLSLINKNLLKKGSVILWDEAGIDIGNRDWQSVTNKVINSLLQTFRHKNFILIFTAPYSDFIDSSSKKLFHAQFETVGINKATKKCKIKPKLLQYNPSMKKWYYHYLKVIKDGRMIKIKRWNIPKPSKEMIDLYEKKKNKFTANLNLELERMLNKFEDAKERSYIQPTTKKALTPKQHMIAQELKTMNASRLAEKLGIGVGAINGHMTALKKKGVVISPVWEEGRLKRYVLENIPEPVFEVLSSEK